MAVPDFILVKEALVPIYTHQQDLQTDRQTDRHSQKLHREAEVAQRGMADLGVGGDVC